MMKEKLRDLTDCPGKVHRLPATLVQHHGLPAQNLGTVSRYLAAPFLHPGLPGQGSAAQWHHPASAFPGCGWGEQGPVAGSRGCASL